MLDSASVENAETDRQLPNGIYRVVKESDRTFEGQNLAGTESILDYEYQEGEGEPFTVYLIVDRDQFVPLELEMSPVALKQTDGRTHQQFC